MRLFFKGGRLGRWWARWRGTDRMREERDVGCEMWVGKASEGQGRH